MSQAERGSARRPVRLAVIGCGAFARLYHVPTLVADPRAELVMICDPLSGEETERLAREAGALLTSEVEELWPAGACDAVLVSSPHALHAVHVRAALAAGKHVLVDKPFVLRHAEAQELAEAARVRGLVGAVAFNRRFDPGSARAREIIRSGGIGAVRHGETVQLGYPSTGWYADPRLGGGGPFIGRGAHMADLLPWLLDRPPRRVRSRILPGKPGRVDAGGFIECEFEGFACYMAVLAHGLYMWDEVRIFGDEGLIELRRPLGRPLGWEMTWWDVRGDRIQAIPADEARGRATTDFLDALHGVATPACSFADACLSVRLIEAAYESSEKAEGWIDL
ncbi:MAG TPA: Gfo/Idh/MocA family oxidoreductase [Candidatus Methylomirabilis sp.]|nr:Gfo/Idh/MocA family oxidoreductase [Candidatus Methylomirabilis sp.]